MFYVTIIHHLIFIHGWDDGWQMMGEIYNKDVDEEGGK